MIFASDPVLLRDLFQSWVFAIQGEQLSTGLRLPEFQSKFEIFMCTLFHVGFGYMWSPNHCKGSEISNTVVLTGFCIPG